MMKTYYYEREEIAGQLNMKSITLQQLMPRQLNIYMQRIKLDPCFIPYTKTDPNGS